MSFYATMAGKLQYRTKEAYDNAVKVLGPWIHHKNIMHEDGVVTKDRENLDPVKLTIEIPLCNYRNLFGVIHQAFRGATGKIVWTSTDGVFDGGVVIDGCNRIYCDLEVWNNAAGGDPAPDYEEDCDDYCAWQDKVEQAFWNQCHS